MPSETFRKIREDYKKSNIGPLGLVILLIAMLTFLSFFVPKRYVFDPYVTQTGKDRSDFACECTVSLNGQRIYVGDRYKLEPGDKVAGTVSVTDKATGKTTTLKVVGYVEDDSSTVEIVDDSTILTVHLCFTVPWYSRLFGILGI